MTKLDESRKKKIEEMVQEAVKAAPAGEWDNKLMPA